jgi:hypothetical protein
MTVSVSLTPMYFNEVWCWIFENKHSAFVDVRIIIVEYKSPMLQQGILSSAFTFKAVTNDTPDTETRTLY